MAGPTNFHPDQNLKPLDCGECEALFAEVVDLTLGKGEPLDSSTALRFNAHVQSCVACADLLTEAQRGNEWLRMLQEEEIAPPADLVSRILAQTSGPIAGTNTAASLSSSTPKPLVSAGALSTTPVTLDASLAESSTRAKKSAKPWSNINLVAIASGARRTISEPRFLMTAAMAFFSITLTFNLLGIHVTQVRPGDLKPGNLARAISRQYTETNARVTRYYDNLKIVYELEARVREFRRNSDADLTRKQQEAKPGGSGPSSQTDAPANRNDHLAGDQNTTPGRDETAPVDPALREVALRHPQARRNSSENLRLQAVCQRRFV